MIILAFLVINGACSNRFTGIPDIGSTAKIMEGLPYFSSTVTTNINEEEETELNINFSIDGSSLIFKNQNNKSVGRIEIGVLAKNTDGEIAVDDKYHVLLGREDGIKYYDANIYNKVYAYKLPPGDYKLELSITDLHTAKRSERRLEATVPDPNLKKLYVNDIGVYEKKNPSGEYYAFNEYSLNAHYDSLKFSFQITKGPETKAVEINSILYEFRSDLEPARYMSGRNFRHTDVEYLGIDYVRYEIIQKNMRRIMENGTVTIDNIYPELPPGNYRYEINIRETDEKPIIRVRDFSIKATNHPYVKSAKDLAEPLYYLMSKGEYQKLMSIDDEDLLKAAVDKFWLSNIKSVPRAKQVVKLYYARVEEANKQFSNFKEGWKTDLGMIYILFGPPLYIDRGFGRMSWFYEFDSGGDTPSFDFEDKGFGITHFPFENFLIKRSNNLFTIEAKQIQAWRDGSILHTSL